jgi:hypothetical protein
MNGYCSYCDLPLPANAKSNRKFCNKVCARNYVQRQWRERNPKSAAGELAKGTVAEANEMRVAIDLLHRGFEVYRAAFQGMPCDMLIKTPHPHSMYRVEVTTGNYSPNGALAHPVRDPTKYDVLAVVVGERIIYKPQLWRL